MRKKANEVSLLVWIMYGVMLVLTIVFIFISNGKHKIKNPIDQQYKDSISFTDGWMDDEGNVINLVKLYQFKKYKAGTEYWLYHRIPANIKEGYTLNISAKNVYYQFYVDGMPLRDIYNPSGRENSFGREYSVIPMEKSMAGKIMAMKLVTVYDGVGSTFLTVSLGLPQGYLLHFAREKMISIVISLLFLFVSVLLILVDIPINVLNQKNHELLALGLFSFAVGMWGLMSAHFLEYFTGDGRTIQIASCMVLILTIIPLFIYIKTSIGYFTRRELLIYATVFFLEFLFVWIMEITSMADVQVVLKVTHIFLGIGLIIILSLAFRKNEIRDINKNSSFYSKFRMIGMTALFLGAVIDFFRYYIGNVADNAVFIRIGLLFFIVFVGIASLEKTIQAVKKGSKAEFIRKLAYQDGLTSLSNRTAFNERMEQLQVEEKNVAIIMFDVNDLKKVNDNLGHQYGDEMLVTSAKIISEVFETVGGECYRIGGDEFVVILFKDNVYEAATDGLHTFREYVKKYNEQSRLLYHIRIAYGFAVLDEANCDVKQLYEIADQKMYECKKQMKKRT